uniref:Uncharacterized protein n=1 Tax=Alexandrium catenella TaxID=2925 RepID=A0A7S1RJ01_ALECA|mmetsp:Transcript_60663/g.162370  ORF Transcript_60663/g.162370 Transcript_60663/m.162370 type:complete len:397 (+) Transcript_60663:48-1238(+)
MAGPQWPREVAVRAPTLLRPLLLVLLHSALSRARRHEVKLVAEERHGHGAQRGVQRTAIDPELDPKSDRHFFHWDYPDDERPSPTLEHTKKFGHPYPVVQDHEAYDKDFVKDENGDNGEWEVQMEYDTLRNKLRGQQKSVNEAYRKEQEERRHLEDEEGKEFKAEEAERGAKEAAGKADAEAGEAHDEVEKLMGKGAADGGKEVGGAVGSAIDEVRDKMKGLEACQKELADAKAKLKELMGLKEKRVKEVQKAAVAKAAATSAAQAKIDKDNAEAAAKYDADVASAEGKLEAVEGDAQSSRDALAKRQKELERKAAEAEAAHAAALKALGEEEAQIEETRTRLKEAAERVRRHRAGVDEEGGIYKTGHDKNRGSRSASIALLSGLVLLVPALPWIA